MEDNIIGLHQADPGIGNAGVGYVVVPDIRSRGEYIQDCYRTETVTIHGGWGYGFMPSVRISTSVLSEISFPPGGDYNRGTAVVWVKDSVSQRPIIVAALGDESKYYEQEERSWRITRQDEETVIDLFADAKNARFQINVLGRDESPAKLDIKVNSLNSGSNASEINVDCDNEINITGSKKVRVLTEGFIEASVSKDGNPKGIFRYDHDNGLTATSENRFTVIVRDEEDEVKMQAQYLCKDIEEDVENEVEEEKAHFTYSDHFGNEFEINEEETHYKDHFNNEFLMKDGEVQVTSENVKHNEGNEPMVLGDTLVEKLNSLFDAISELTVPTGLGPSGTPINIVNFKKIQGELEEILSKKSLLE